MTKIKRTDSSDPDFISLVRLLDAELAERDGDDHPFYAQFNSLDEIKEVVIAYIDEVPAGCGSMKINSPGTLEVKRMYVATGHRGKGLASMILAELETWAKELNFHRFILETGFNQPEAIALYHKNGYHRISNYGPYANVESSACFEKRF
ncbi:MAG TPA: GNAT family N-acetyltransferase [Saprospiraceae bacterium]|nr:GNAT family N-acetyltransferase [Saprospiraceae bacterium]